MTISHFYASKITITAMDQCKLKKVMMLTQRWIQDNHYKNHAENMKHNEWLQIRTSLHKWNPDWTWTYDPKNQMIYDNGRLTDRGMRSRYMCHMTSTFTLTYAESGSTNSDINLADYDK